MGASLKTMYYDAGKNAGAAFKQGYDEKQGTGSKQDFTQVIKDSLLAEGKRQATLATARQAAEVAARLKALKNHEADLKVRLAQVAEGSRQEMQLKQQLIGVQAKIELEDSKKSEADKRVIRAEALDKIQDLEQAFNAKQAAEAEKRRKELEKLAAEAAKKEREALHAEQDARLALMTNDRLRELAENDLHVNRKIEALTGSEAYITEMKLLLEEERRQKETEIRAKWDEEDAKKQEEYQQQQAELNAAADEEYLAYLQNKLANQLLTEQEYQDALYNLKKQALEDQL